MEHMENIDSLRWRVVIGGMICQVCAGTLYTWSVYANSLMSLHSWTKVQVSWTFSIAVLFIPIAQILGGKLLHKIGPAKVIFLGAAFLVSGLAVASFIPTIPALYLGYGFLGGIGVGFIYIIPVSTCAKWFPDRKGLVTGLIVAGFGLGSILFTPLCLWLLKSMTAHSVFLVQAAIIVTGIIIGAPLMKIAPDGYSPKGWTPASTAADGTATPSHNYTTPEMLRTRQYWFLLVMYLFANLGGLFVIGSASPIAQTVANLSPELAGSIVVVLAIVNTIGRLISGAAVDKLGAARVVTIVYTGMAALFFSMPFMTTYALIAMGIGGVALCFGAIAGAYPTLVNEYFGVKYLSTNYSFVFLAYGIGGFSASFVYGISERFFGGLSMTFTIIGICCVIGVVMSLLAKKPVYKPAEG